MVPLVSWIGGALRRDTEPPLGGCMVCAAPVRASDDRLRIHGGYVHTGCAGYRLRRLGTRSRAHGSPEANRAFTGD